MRRSGGHRGQTTAQAGALPLRFPAASADPRGHSLLVLLVVSCLDCDEALWFARKKREKKKSSCGKKQMEISQQRIKRNMRS